jgi:hypothetical protein
VFGLPINFIYFILSHENKYINVVNVHVREGSDTQYASELIASASTFTNQFQEL